MARRGMEPHIIEIDGIQIGVNLSADFVSEHEWGIKGILAAFEADHDKGCVNGFDRMRVSRIPPEDRASDPYGTWLCLVKNKGRVGFSFRARADDDEVSEQSWRKVDAGLVAAWSDRDFIVMATLGTKTAKFLTKELYPALRGKDAVFAFAGTGNPFGNSGLCILIRSRIPKSLDNEVRAAQQERLDLEQ
jgi:hypothetical protein